MQPSKINKFISSGLQFWLFIKAESNIILWGANLHDNQKNCNRKFKHLYLAEKKYNFIKQKFNISN